MDSEVERYVKLCQGCQLVGQAHARDPIRVTELPNGPWEYLACDLLGPLDNWIYILVVVDYYSRYYECRYMQSIVPVKVIEVLLDMFRTHGLPFTLKSDNGPQFISSEFSRFMVDIGVKHHLVTPRWPEANGEVERQIPSLMKSIKIGYGQGENFKKEIHKYLRAYRNTPHSITGKTPAEMLFDRNMRTTIPHVRDVYDDLEARDRDAEMKHLGVARKNLNKSGHDITVGSSVLVLRDHRSKCKPPYHHEPYTVREVNGPMLVLESRDGRVIKRNITFVRLYLLPDDHFVDTDSNGAVCNGTDVDGAEYGGEGYYTHTPRPPAAPRNERIGNPVPDEIRFFLLLLVLEVNDRLLVEISQCLNE